MPVIPFGELYSLLTAPDQLRDEKASFRLTQLRIALGDLREAIRSPNLTAFFCYRAIESLRQCYLDPDKRDDEAERRNSWQLMRNELRVDRSWINQIQEASTLERHGILQAMSGEQRVNLMLHTWKVVDRFILSAKNQFQPLSEEILSIPGLAMQEATVTTTACPNEFNHAEDPARRLLERLGWTYVARDTLAAERGGEREVLLKGRLRAALLRLNEWLTDAQAERVIFELENVNATGMARNQAVHEYLTYGMPLTVDGSRGRDTRTVRFFDFEHPEAGLNEFVVTTQFRVRRGNERDGPEDDERLVIPDLVLFVNGIPLVVMEAKSPSLLDVWKSQAVRQLRRYQEAGPEWQGRGAPELFHYNLLCVAHCGAAAAYSTLNAPENAYFEWKWLGSYTDDEVKEKFGAEPQGQAQLIIGLLAPATLLDILRDYVVYEPERGRLVKKLPRYQQYRAVRAALARILSADRPTERGGVIWHTQGSGKSLTMLWLATKIRREPRLANTTIAVVTDRTQLDRQIAGTFERCGFPGPSRKNAGPVAAGKGPASAARWTSRPSSGRAAAAR